MRFSVIGSGSKGNCTLVESGCTRVLIDNGFSGKELISRLQQLGIASQSLTALVVTHEHEDHVKGVGVLARRLNLPIYANAPTFIAAEGRTGKLPCTHEFGTGEPFVIQDIEIHPFAVSHDTADPVGFVFNDGAQQLGYCTDTGKITRLVKHHLQRCQALILEANHDVAMLKAGPYPPPLKQRVLSSIGHLANTDSIAFAAELQQSGLQILVLAHLSEINNHPDRVLDEVHRRLGGLELEVVLASQNQVSPLRNITSR